MTSLNFVKAARKDYPEAGIRKGDSYYWWAFKFGPKHRSKTKPDPGVLIRIDFLRSVYDIGKSIGELTIEDIRGADIDSITSEIESLREEQEEKLSNMEEYNLSEGDVGQMIQECVDELQSWQDELEGVSIPDEVEKPKGYDEREAEDKLTKTDEEYRSYLEELESALEEIQGTDYGGP